MKHSADAMFCQRLGHMPPFILKNMYLLFLSFISPWYLVGMRTERSRTKSINITEPISVDATEAESFQSGADYAMRPECSQMPHGHQCLPMRLPKGEVLVDKDALRRRWPIADGNGALSAPGHWQQGAEQARPQFGRCC